MSGFFITLQRRVRKYLVVLQSGRMRKGVFLDRDGTVLRLFAGTGYVTKRAHMRLLPNAAHAIRALNKAGYLVFIHTNQAIIARGHLTEKKLGELHDALCERLRMQGARIDGIYYCPHHPKASVRAYRKVCACRKPKSGMLRRAVRQHRLDASGSVMIGDSSKDILAGKRAGMRTILVLTGNAGREPHAVRATPDFVAKDLLMAVRQIVRSSPRVANKKRAGMRVMN